MANLKVTLSKKYVTKDGESVEHYEVGDWIMELVGDEYDEELAHAKHGMQAYKAWYRWLKKKNRKKYKTS